MSATREDVLKAALSLSPADRLLIAEELMSTLPDVADVGLIEDPEYIAELDRRWNDGSPRIPWSKVREELRRDLDE